MTLSAEREPTTPAARVECIQFRLGTNVLDLEPYGRDAWRSADGSVHVRKDGRTWLASFGVGLEYLGPFKKEMALCMARGRGLSREEAETSLDAELEAIRQRIGAPEAVT